MSQRSLGQPDASLSESFSSIRGLRELPDGRVMIADGLGQALIVADFRRGSLDTLGRVGQGPEEYRQPDGVFALPRDSTLLVDLGNGRLTALGPRGAFGATMPLARGGADGGMVLVLPEGTDSLGRIYFRATGGGGGLPDSAPVLRLDRGTGRVDTVAMVKLEDRQRSSSGGSNNQNVSIRPLPLTKQDGWAVGWDGRVAVVRSGDYSVDVIYPDGRRLRGEPIPFKPVRVRQADKEAWLEQLSNSGLRVEVAVENGRRRMAFSRGGNRLSNPDDFVWPDTKPAFVGSGVRVAWDGVAWVERHMPSGSPPTFDLFDGQGRRTLTVALPKGRRIVGFGRGVVYLAHADEFDLQWLERYRL